ncbi:DUF58 domain-containing protein [Crateriforma conspicua]|nr:DUF58 domain-containing protein [Crateriforma conspicua]
MNSTASKDRISRHTESRPTRRGVFWTLLRFPVRVFRWVRATMTPVSITLLLITIVTLNVIWGYPWTGMFAACCSMLFFGWIANRAFGPRLDVDVMSAVACEAGQSMMVRVHVRNAGRLPILQSWFQLGRLNRDDATSRLTSAGDIGATTQWSSRRTTDWIVQSSRRRLPFLRPGESIDLNYSLVPQRRGRRRLPAVNYASTFPFHLFRFSRGHRVDEMVTVTPRPLTGDDGDEAMQLIQSVGQWARRILAGESMEYTGSREYQVGMSVRRWDFASWARLGKPIVREFSANSVIRATLLVDTSLTIPPLSSKASRRDRRRRMQHDRQRLEKLLSAAATVVHRLTEDGIQVDLAITGQDDEQGNLGTVTQGAVNQAMPLLMRLAVADRCRPEQAVETIAQASIRVGSGSLLVLRNESFDPSEAHAALVRSGVPVEPADVFRSVDPAVDGQALLPHQAKVLMIDEKTTNLPGSGATSSDEMTDVTATVGQSSSRMEPIDAA